MTIQQHLERLENAVLFAGEYEDFYKDDLRTWGKAESGSPAMEAEKAYDLSLAKYRLAQGKLKQVAGELVAALTTKGIDSKPARMVAEKVIRGGNQLRDAWEVCKVHIEDALANGRQQGRRGRPRKTDHESILKAFYRVRETWKGKAKGLYSEVGRQLGISASTVEKCIQLEIRPKELTDEGESIASGLTRRRSRRNRRNNSPT